VIVSLEVCEEIESGGLSGFAVVEFHAASWLTKLSTRTEIDPFLGKVLDYRCYELFAGEDESARSLYQ
jgi:hypothetical protein